MKLITAILIVGSALVMSGCSAGRLIVQCTITNPQNCN